MRWNEASKRVMGQLCFKDRYEDVKFETRENDYTVLETVGTQSQAQDENGDYCEITNIDLELKPTEYKNVPRKLPTPPADQVHLVVAALDFGTTYSGWGYSLRDDFLTDPSKVTVKHWNSGNMISYKAPTCILLSPDGDSVKAFGYDAETEYAALINDGKHRDFYFFSRFKMELHKSLQQGIKRDFELEDDTGKRLKAIKVFALCIKWLKEDLFSEWKNRIPGIVNEDDVYWVLTVPAIWSEAAKQFMRKAAEEAGIKRERLSIVLEPEVASVLCRHVTAKEDTDDFFRNGLKYIILDAGGGTVDITIHEVVDEKGLKEIASASGGNWGGIKVDAAFGDLLQELVGKDVYQEFSINHRDDFLDLLRNFEIKKRTLTGDSESDIIFTLPLSLTEIYMNLNNQSLSDSIKRSDFKLTKNKLRCSASIIKELFRETCENIAEHIAKLLDQSNCSDVSAIMMVGGFSESAILQDNIRQCFPHLKVFVPRDASLCVLKGAVLYGHNPKVIAERVVRYTYGTSVFKVFEDGIDPVSKKLHTERGYVCKDVFSKHVRQQQVVKAGEAQKERLYRPLKTTQTKMTLPIFASKFRNPRYVTDSGCTQIGAIIVDMPCTSEGLSRDVLVTFTFSGTEINVTAKDISSGNVTNVTVDFLR